MTSGNHTIIDIGEMVLCDLCNADYTDSEAEGGILMGPNIEKLPYGATECFCSPDRWFDCLCGVHFAEKDA